MKTDCNATRQNRTIIVDFKDEPTCFALLQNGKAFIEFIVAFLLSIGFQLKHKPDGCGGSCLTRHSHYILWPRATAGTCASISRNILT